MTALAIRDDQTAFDEFQIAVLRQSGVDEDCSNAELAAFLHTCQRRHLDPFAGQIVLIGRNDKQKGRKVYKAQTTIDGFRLIARRASDRAGIDYEYEGTIWYDAKGGRHEAWLSAAAPAAARVVVLRNGRRYDAVARYGAYLQTNYKGEPGGQWRTMPDVMIAKCAEALALRKAFPEDLGGLYTAEEMGQADNEVPYQPNGPVTVRAEVVKDDHPAAEVVTDPEWLGEMNVACSTFTSNDDGNTLWRRVNEKGRAGGCTADDADTLKDLIRARWQELPKDSEDGDEAGAEEVAA
jgi:phage recombination protein Bet